MSDEIQQMREQMDRNERELHAAYAELKQYIERERDRLTFQAHFDAIVKVLLVVFILVVFWILYK